jgi:uncharacterized protein YndB with AHSA1/START domain
MSDELAEPSPEAPTAPITEVTRSVEVDADASDVWRAVADPDERALWLDDPDALVRRVRVDESDPGQRLVWTWWHPGDEDDASTVSVVLRPADGGGTRVTVTETASSAPRATARAQTPDGWRYRLLGLELLFLTAGALVR